MLPIVMKCIRQVAICALFSCVVAGQTPAQESAAQQQPPIIDMHIHAFSWDHQGNPPPPNPVTGKVPTARTDKKRWRRRWLS